jgi:hypothetical protein
VKGCVRSAVLNEHEGLVRGLDGRAVEGVTGDNVDIIWEVFLECGDFGGFARRLTANDGTEFGSFAKATTES